MISPAATPLRKTATACQREGHPTVIARDSPTGQVVGQIANGTIVAVLQEGVDTVQVSWSGKFGWVKSHNLIFAKATPAAKLQEAPQPCLGKAERAEASPSAPCQPNARSLSPARRLPLAPPVNISSKPLAASHCTVSSLAASPATVFRAASPAFAFRAASPAAALRAVSVSRLPSAMPDVQRDSDFQEIAILRNKLENSRNELENSRRAERRLSEEMLANKLESSRRIGELESKLEAVERRASVVQQFCTGDRVKARYRNGEWYDAVIADVRSNGLYVLQWADGDVEDTLKSAHELQKPCQHNVFEDVRAFHRCADLEGVSLIWETLAKPQVAEQARHAYWQAMNFGVQVATVEAGSAAFQEVERLWQKTSQNRRLSRILLLNTPLRNTFIHHLKLLSHGRGDGTSGPLNPSGYADADYQVGLSHLKDNFVHSRELPQHANVVFSWHGTGHDVYEVAGKGLRPLRSTDGGFFGGGSYTSLEAWYAARYASSEFGSMPTLTESML